jgi:hypothetical protein
MTPYWHKIKVVSRLSNEVIPSGVVTPEESNTSVPEPGKVYVVILTL